MKTQVFILFFLAFTLNNIYSQSGILNRKVKIDIKEGTIEEILEEVSTKAGFIFSYGQDIPQDKYVKLKNSHQTVREFLEELFGNDIYCVEYGNKLIIRKKPKSPAVTIQGKVVDADTKESIPGVTVFIPDTDPLIGAVSDQNGNFQIDMPGDQNIIRLSCIGYESSSISPDQSSHLNVELNPENQEISEVIIVYYEHKNTDINGAVSSIPTEKIEKSYVNTIEEAIQGNASGVFVVRNSGMPGSSLQVKIRGINSLINSEPVYYIDGIPIQQTSVYAISPHDIESIEILKDASITARYGATAGNGVVLLKSRKGNTTNTNFTFDYYYGHQQVWKKPDLMTSSEFLEFYENVRPFDDRYDILDSIYKTNWVDLAFHNAKTEDFHFSVSGGEKKSTFYLGSGYYTQSSIIKDLELKRYSFRINSQHKIGQRIHLGQDISLAYLNHKGLKEGSFLNDAYNPILGSLCMLPLSASTDSLPVQISEQISMANPNNDFELTNNLRNNYTLFSTLNASINVFPEIKYHSKLGFEIYYQDNVSFNRQQPAEFLNSTDLYEGNEYNIQDMSFDWMHSVVYSPYISKDRSLHFQLGYEYSIKRNKWIPVQRGLYDNLMNTIDTLNLMNEPFLKLETATDFLHHAYYGCVEYEFRNRYQANLLLRKDIVGFDSKHKLLRLSDIYPSFSLGWIFSKEGFFPQAGILQFGKIRYGWGRAGNSPRLNYTFYAKMMRDAEYVYAFPSASENPFSAGPQQTNDEFYLENMNSHNLGLDLGLFRNKLFISIDYFNTHLHKGEKYSADIPINFIQILNQWYFSGIKYLPVAEIINKGFEYEFNYKYAGYDLSYNIAINLTHLKNEILDIEEGALVNLYNAESDHISVNIPGNPAGSFYGYKIDRLFKEEDCDQPAGYVTNQPYTTGENGEIIYAQPDAQAGDYKFVDMNSDGIINNNDKTIIGNPFPKFTYGMSFNMEYFNFDFFIFFQGSYGNDIFNATKLWLYNPYGLSNWTRDIVNSYRSPVYNSEGEPLDEGVTDTDLHRFNYSDRNFNLRVSDFYVEDGSYLRLKNIQLGYIISPSLTKKVRIQKFRIYLCAQNLFTITSYSGLDPEVGGWGVDCGIYPQPRVYLAGVNLEF
ncbi:MAG: SusC/RagA family TonB-linked outer membrane protein [Bacteroidales bacterium]|nr:MAG: SusC/RagA family TonB-linked outer membrane protein [Bacteroidales bacterium]